MIYELNIKDIYFSLIKNNIKKHEYRLNNDKRKNIKINDVIKLINNETKEIIYVLVKDINYYSNWDEALDKYWFDDFKGLYNNKEEVVNECLKFYKLEDINKYGIVVFEIEKIKNIEVLQ